MKQSILPEFITDTDQLDCLQSEPTDRVIESISRLQGDIIILGVAGKMGPALARMAMRALQEAGIKRRVIGVSRFSNVETQQYLESHGIETIRGDLLDPDFVESLPEVPNVIFMAGMKFGAEDQNARTWAMNVYLPALVCRKFHASRIVAFSTGNIYGLVPATGSGSVETDDPRPVGEYAMSCLGRERIFEYFSQTNSTPITIIRLNYSHELRYGVLVDLAQQIDARQTIALGMPVVNVIWQGDACAMILQSLADAACPALFLNVAGPEILSVHEVCEKIGQSMGKPVSFSGVESKDALLSNAKKSYQQYGTPRVSAEQLIRWTTHWVTHDGETYGKPTHFEVRDGKF